MSAPALPAAPRSPFVGEKDHIGRLVGLVLVSAVLHAFAFFAFQVTVPARAALQPLPHTVALLTGRAQGGAAILRWIADEDPARAAAAAHAPVHGLMAAQYTPSFLRELTPPRFVASNPAPIRFPAAFDPVDLIERSSVAATTPATDSPSAATHLVLSGALNSRSLAAPPQFGPFPGIILADAKFLLGVTGQGEVQFAFLQSGTGHGEVDAAALASLQRLSFAPSSQELTWGFASIEWGSDISSHSGASPAPAPKADTSP